MNTHLLEIGNSNLWTLHSIHHVSLFVSKINIGIEVDIYKMLKIYDCLAVL